MKKHYRYLSLTFTLLVSLVMGFGLTACGGDVDEPDGGISSDSYYDYSVLWSVVDRGDYTPADAQSVAASFSNASEDLIEHQKPAQAIRLFEDFMEELRYEFSEDYKNITLQADLVANVNTNHVLASRKLVITPKGSSIKAPAMRPTVSDPVVAEMLSKFLGK